jgi:soluble lytic murein transglycosylase-like protein
MKQLRYTAALLWSVFRRPPTRPQRRSLRPLLLLLLLSLTVAAWTMGVDGVAHSNVDEVQLLSYRIERLNRSLQRAENIYDIEIAPLERVLRSQGADERLARRTATALVTEARRTRVEPRLLLGVLLVENPWIDPRARSPVGAQGLMQVMPFHRGNWQACEPRLDAIEANICHGAHIFASYLKSERGNVERALLRYNGCVRGTNTPNCHSYPTHVLAGTGRATLHDWRQQRAGIAASP